MRRTTRGLALVVVSWMLVLLIVVTFGATYGVQTAFEAESVYYGRLRAEWLARAGLERAAMVLKDDTRDVDSTHETWWDADEEDFARAEIGDGGYELVRDDFSDDDEPHYGMVDEASKLNVNTATYDMLMLIPGMTEEIADAIIDWRDADSAAGANGAETDYYQELAVPYEAKNAAFETLRELLLVKGIDAAVFFGEDADADGILDEDENDGDTSAPDDNADGVLDRGLQAYLTANSIARNVDAQGTKRVNINTAEAGDLKQAGFNDDEANAIVAQRKSGEFETIIHLLDIEKTKVTPTDVRRSRRQGSTSDTQKAISEARLRDLADKLTVSDEESLPGRVNVNTASLAVLEAVFGDENIAAAVQEYARSSDGPFNNIAELLLVDLVTVDVLKKVANAITVRSDTFRVRSVGRLGEGSVSVAVEALLMRDETDVVIRYARVVH